MKLLSDNLDLSRQIGYKQPMQFFNRIVATLLSLQIFLAPVAAYAVEQNAPHIERPQAIADQDPALLADTKGLEAALQVVEESADDALPPASVDSFGLVGQTLEYFGNGVREVYDLSSLQANLPRIVPPNFERDVTFEVEPVGLVMIYRDKGKVIARHIFPKFDPIAMVRDKEMLVILGPKGHLVALDMLLAERQGFVSPLPMVKLVRTRVALDPAKVSMHFLKRSTPVYDAVTVDPEAIVPLDKNQNLRDPELLTSGDLMVYNHTENRNVLVARLDRNVIRDQISLVEGVLASLAPAGADLLTSIGQILKDDKVRKNVAESSRVLNQDTRKAVTALTTTAVKNVIDRATTSRAEIVVKRDQFDFDEWRQGFERLSAIDPASLIEKKDPTVPERIRAATVNALSSKTLRTIAAVVGGAAATAVVADNYGPLWAIHLIDATWDYLWPEVFSDATYTVTLLKSMGALALLVPAVYSISALVAKRQSRITGEKIGVFKMQAIMAMRSFGALQLPFWHYLAKWTRQPNLIAALRSNVNPFRKVTADSGAGKQLELKKDVPLLGFSNPFSSSRIENARVKADLLSELVSERMRIRELAQILSLRVASEEAGIDPATLQVMMTRNASTRSEAELNQIADSEKFRADWQLAAQKINSTLLRLNDPLVAADVGSISKADMALYYREAKAVAESLKTRSGLGMRLERGKAKFAQITSSLMGRIADFGTNENEYLRRAQPDNDLVTKPAAQQFIIDYWFAVGLIGLVGERAHLDDPQALSAEAGNFFWTSQGHRFDMFNQVQIYGITVPATFALTYQYYARADAREDAYDPIEAKSLKGVDKVRGYWTSLGYWFANAASLDRVNYGFWANKKFSKTWKSIQAGAALAISARMVLGGQDLETSILTFIFTSFTSYIYFGVAWEPIVRGGQVTEKLIEAKNASYMDIKTRLGTAMRNDDTPAMMKAYDELKLWSREENEPTPSELEPGRMLQGLLEVGPEELAELRTEIGADLGAMRMVREAIVSGNPGELDQARQVLVDRYASTPGNALPADLLKLNSLSLLTHVLKNPPLVTKDHPWRSKHATLLGAYVTTLLGTMLFVQTFRPGVNWTHRILEAAAIAAVFYPTVWFGQKLINKVGPSIRRQLGAQPKSCSKLFKDEASPALIKASVK